MSRRPERKTPAALRRLAEWETRVAEQKQFISDLQANGRRTASAEATLKKYEGGSVLQLRNYSQLPASTARHEPK
jgi:hypothetical protein